MTEKELANKAFEYRTELVPYTELGFPDVAIPVYEALDIDRAYVAGAKAMQEENEQLNHIRHLIELQKQKQEMECNKMASTIIEELKNKNEQLKAQIDKLKEEKQYETCPYRSTDMGCDYCDYKDRDLKDEVEE